MTRFRALAAALVGLPLLAVGGYFVTTSFQSGSPSVTINGVLEIHGSAVHIQGSAPSSQPALSVSPSGNDGSCARGGGACSSWGRAYQLAQPGDTISVGAGTYGGQVIPYRGDLANTTTCSPPDTSRCVTFAIPGRPKVTGYIDTEADSAANHPDHVFVENTDSTSFGIFNVDTATFKNMDVGPGTVSTGCGELQGPGIENKIGYAGGVVYVPRNIVIDGMKIHDQNGDSGRINSDCHFGGLFLAGVQGLTIQNTTFEANVVYHVQIQPIGGAPITNVTFNNDAFSCPADWLYNGSQCDGQSSIQFDGTFPGVTITNSAFAEGGNRGWGCYAGTCDYSQDTFSGNTFAAASLTAPPLPTGTVTTPGTTTSNPPTTTAIPTTTCCTLLLELTLVSKTASSITFKWIPPGGVGYEFLRDGVRVASTFNPAQSQVKFSYRAGSVYTVRALSKLVEGSASG